MTILYGIKNCDTIKKARKWLEANNIEYGFHDYRVDGLDADLLKTLEAQLGWENMLNKRGTTFRNLPDVKKENLQQQSALQLMLEYPALIKRPILAVNNNMKLGFKAAEYEAFFNE